MFRERRQRRADGLAADAEPSLAAGGARGRERALRRRVRRRVPAAGACGRRRPGAAERLRAAGHGQGRGRRVGRPLAPVRGAATSPGASASWSTQASRRPARSSSSSPRAPTPSGSRRSSAPSACRRTVLRGATTSGSSRSPTCSPYLRLLHNRYDDEALLTVLASPFVGVSNDALVLIRAEAQRQPVFRGLERPLPGDLAENDRAAAAGVPSALRAAARAGRARAARAPVRACSGGARLRPRRSSPATTAAAATRTSASSRGSPGRTRSSAGRTSRDSSASSEGQEAVGAKESDAVLRGGGRGRGPAADDPRREGARIQGRRRRRRRAEPAARLRHPRASPTAASASRSPIPRPGRGSAPPRTRT